MSDPQTPPPIVLGASSPASGDEADVARERERRRRVAQRVDAEEREARLQHADRQAALFVKRGRRQRAKNVLIALAGMVPLAVLVVLQMRDAGWVGPLGTLVLVMFPALALTVLFLHPYPRKDRKDVEEYMRNRKKAQKSQR